MPIVNDEKYFTQKGAGLEFNAEHGPGGEIKYSGIYRCVGCGHEVVAEKGRKLPPENHHEHAPWEHGDIRWQLVARPK